MFYLLLYDNEFHILGSDAYSSGHIVWDGYYFNNVFLLSSCEMDKGMKLNGEISNETQPLETYDENIYIEY